MFFFAFTHLQTCFSLPCFRNAVAERVRDTGNVRRRPLPAEAGGPREPRAREGVDRSLGRREQLPEVNMHDGITNRYIP